MTLRVPALVLAALCAASVARADEPIATGASGPPPAAEAPQPLRAQDSPEAIGDWARGVMAGAPSAEAAAAGPAGQARACPPKDGKPHGEVWAGVGTGGYRDVGGVVTQPLGDCGSVTLGVSRSAGRWR